MKEILPDLPAGTIVCQIAGGGGGYGSPYQRPPEQVAREVRNGVLSDRKAMEDYGVVIRTDSFEADLTETIRVRQMRET